MVWCGVVWCGVVWCGVVWCSLMGQQVLLLVTGKLVHRQTEAVRVVLPPWVLKLYPSKDCHVLVQPLLQIRQG